MLFGVIGIAPGVSWQLIAAALLLMISISVVVTLVSYFVLRSYTSERAMRVAMMTLSNNERAVLGKIMDTNGEIRQDDLWRRLRENYSKSKLSQLVINLEKKHAITRTRYHRTNILKLTPEFSKR